MDHVKAFLASAAVGTVAMLAILFVAAHLNELT